MLPLATWNIYARHHKNQRSTDDFLRMAILDIFIHRTFHYGLKAGMYAGTAPKSIVPLSVPPLEHYPKAYSVHNIYPCDEPTPWAVHL